MTTKVHTLNVQREKKKTKERKPGHQTSEKKHGQKGGVVDYGGGGGGREWEPNCNDECPSS